MLKAIRKMVFLFIPMLLIFLLLQGIVGEKGYLVNKELEKINAENAELLARLEVKKAALEKYEESLSSQEVLDDIALKLGYNKSGEQVYFFTEGEETEMDALSVMIDDKEAQKLLSFKGVSTPWILLISIGSVLVPFLIVLLVQFIVRRKRDEYPYDERRSYDNDYSF